MTDAEGDFRTLRQHERKRLLEERRRLTSAERTQITEAIASNLDKVIASAPCRVLGIYWPINGEFDLRPWAMTANKANGIELALPVVVRQKEPLEYWAWRERDPMARGFWNIMVPAERRLVLPDTVIAPLDGHAGLFRLGYGGGYFDRTLAASFPRPRAIGVGLEAACAEGYRPEPHDVPMDMIVTEAGIRSRTAPEARQA